MVFAGGYFRRLDDCADCGRFMPIDARGLCSACWTRNSDNGTLGEFGYVKADRLADFAEMRGLGVAVPAAAARLGVSERTAWRYEAELKAGERSHAA
jgi:hypothetical protein